MSAKIELELGQGNFFLQRSFSYDLSMCEQVSKNASL